MERMEYKKDKVKGITWNMHRCSQVQLFLKTYQTYLLYLLVTRIERNQKKNMDLNVLKCLLQALQLCITF